MDSRCNQCSLLSSYACIATTSAEIGWRGDFFCSEGVDGEVVIGACAMCPMTVHDGHPSGVWCLWYGISSSVLRTL